MNALMILLTMSLVAANSTAQASSTNHVLTSAETGAGTTTSSMNYALTASLGDGVVAGASGSTNFALLGGFTATLDVGPLGQPWLMGIEPRYVTMKSGATLALHGTELNLGPTPTITVGGLAATLGTRHNPKITVKLPFQPGPISQPGPGWQPVTVSNSFGTTSLPRGVGILPMLECDPAPAPNTRFDIVFRGTQGDQIVWAIGAQPTAPISIPGILYGLGLDPAVMLMLPALAITAPSGELRFEVPPTPYGGPVYVQAAFVTNNAGYGPASFSNLITL